MILISEKNKSLTITYISPTAHKNNKPNTPTLRFSLIVFTSPKQGSRLALTSQSPSRVFGKEILMTTPRRR